MHWLSCGKPFCGTKTSASDDFLLAVSWKFVVGIWELEAAKDRVPGEPKRVPRWWLKMFSYVIQASALPWSRNELTEFSRTGLDVLHAGFYVGRRENFVKLHVALQVDLAGSWCTLEPPALAGGDNVRRIQGRMWGEAKVESAREFDSSLQPWCSEPLAEPPALALRATSLGWGRQYEENQGVFAGEFAGEMWVRIWAEAKFEREVEVKLEKELKWHLNEELKWKLKEGLKWHLNEELKRYLEKELKWHLNEELK